MKISNQLMDKIIQRFFDLYITAQYKYLILNPNGNYYTYNTYENKKHQKLKKWHIREHINGTHTLGIFAASYVTSFICFDVDVRDPMNAKWTVYKLVDVLNEIGIPNEYIYISTSGNKGYHVDIYFSNPMLNEIVKDFYNIVIEQINMDHVKGDIELRPTNQGLKLPLGHNFKNKTTNNKCWYVDFYNGLKPIKSYKYILNIKQIDTELFKEILNENKIIILDNKIEKEEAVKVESVKGYLDSKYHSLENYNKNIDSKLTIENAIKLDTEGLKHPGTRHNSIYSLCKYYKYIGMNEEENENSLIEWMNEQDTRSYNTELKECYKDISEIVSYIYKNDINLLIKNKEIIITYSEILNILNAKSKNEKLLLYAMLIHSKRYANNVGVFYMSYNQMVLTTGLGERTVKRLVNNLEEDEHIKIIQRNKKITNNKGKFITKRPNKYKVLYDELETNLENKIVTLHSDDSISLNGTLLNMFELSYLRTILPDRHYRELLQERQKE